MTPLPRSSSSMFMSETKYTNSYDSLIFSCKRHAADIPYLALVCNMAMNSLVYVSVMYPQHYVSQRSY